MMDNRGFENNYNKSSDSKQQSFTAKHFSQMTENERWYLLKKKDRLIGYNTLFSEHAIERMSERRITERDIVEAVRMGQIIEYRKTWKDERITIRATRLKKKQFVVYVSFSIRDNVVVTTYYDDARNIHKQRDFTKYDESLQVQKKF